MSKQPEAKFRARAMRRLNDLPNAYFERVEDSGKRGVLDAFGHVGGFAVWIEFKSDGGKPSHLQVKKVYDVVTTGGIAVFVWPDNFEEVLVDLKCLQSVSAYVRMQEKYSEIAQEMYFKLREISQTKLPYGHDERL